MIAFRSRGLGAETRQRRVGTARSLLIAAALVAGVTAVRWALDPLLGAEYNTIFFIVAVVLAAYIDGTRCAVLSTLMSLPVVLLIFASPRYSILPLRSQDVIGAMVFLVSGLAIAFISGRMSLLQRRAERSAAEHSDELQRVADQLRLSERMALVGTLTAGIAHDIGNTLLPMRARLELLQSRLSGETDDGEQDVQRVRLFADHLASLARGLSNLIADPAGTCHGRTSLREWQEVATPLLRSAVPRSVELRVDVPEDVPEVAIAQHALSQAVFNAVHNAGKAMERSGRASGRVRVEASSDPQRGAVRITVADDGPGMAPAALAALSEARPRFDRERGVSGMGLPLLRSIVESVGGSVSIASEPGRGTELDIEIPAVRREAAVP
jgi:signal transduction histidine kinase